MNLSKPIIFNLLLVKIHFLPVIFNVFLWFCVHLCPQMIVIYKKKKNVIYTHKYVLNIFFHDNNDHSKIHEVKKSKRSNLASDGLDSPSGHTFRTSNLL